MGNDDTEETLRSILCLEKQCQLEGKDQDQSGLQTNKREPIAIVGISCRLPGANNCEEFWDLIANGKEAIGSFPEGRLSQDNSKGFSNGKKHPNAGWLKCPVDEADGKFFGMSPLELSFTDPQQRLLLEVSWEALEDAAIDPTSLQSSPTGIFTGAWTNDYRDLLLENGYADAEFIRSYMGNSHGATAGRLAHFLGTSGPTFATEAGCSSSMAAVGLACESLRRFKSNVALACGVNLLLRPFSVENIRPVISPSGHCKTFDKDADGYVRAEGCAVLVLKRLSDAAKSGDRIHSLIRGYGESQEGKSKSVGAPTVDCEAEAIKQALQDAGVRPNEVGYVEAHGTGTPIGDYTEIKAITEVYSEGRNKPLYIGSVKTNIGHTESCSGITGIIKTILSLKNEVIPPHINLVNINPGINLERIPAIIPLKKIPWGKVNGQKRLAGVSSFGLTGKDTHVIIEEAPDAPMEFSMEEGYELLPISAKSEKALDLLLKNYQTYLNENSKIPISDTVFTASIGRHHFDHRAAIIGKSNADLVANLSSGIILKGVKSEEKPRICFLFTGQGSQFSGMGKILYEKSPVFKMHLDNCKAAVETTLVGVSILDVMWNPNSLNELNRSLYSNVSIFCLEYCLLKLWESFGVTPEVVCGHSLGEFAAAVAAGVLTFEDALELVVQRSFLVETLPEGRMLVTNLNLSDVRFTIMEFLTYFRGMGYWIDIAAANSETQTVVSGSPESIQKFLEFCKGNGITSQLLASKHAFHSRDMDPILMKYKDIAEKVNYSKPVCKYISGVLGKAIEEEVINAEYWIKHTRDEVKFLDSCNEIYNTGVRIFIEIGPQPVLSALVMKNCQKMVSKLNPIMCLPSMNKNLDEWKTILTSVGKLYTNGVEINWEKMYGDRKCRKVSLPFYPFQRKKTWFEPRKLFKTRSIQGNQFIHPFLGAVVPNPTKYKIFRGWIDINCSSYLADHVIGENVIFPGAGYIEMFLAASSNLDEFSKKLMPITVKNILFEKPMRIDESSICELQTVLSADESDGGINVVNIFRAENGMHKDATKWIRHSSAKVSLAMSSHKNEQNIEELEAVKERMKQKEKINIQNFYENLWQLGLHFAPVFQSLKEVYLHDGETFVRIDVPEGASEYLIHPVVIDAMIQASMVVDDSEIETLKIPAAIEKFNWLAKSDSRVNFIHVREKMNGSANKIAVLYDAQGVALAIMEGVTFQATSLDSINKSVQLQNNAVTELTTFEQFWRQDADSKNYPVEIDFEMFSEKIQTIQEEFAKYNRVEGVMAQDLKALNSEIALEIMITIGKLGLVPKPGDIFEIQNLIKDLKISPTYFLLFRRLLGILVEDGYFVELPNDSIQIVDWYSIETATNKMKEMIATIEEMTIERDLTTACFPKLAPTLLGKDNALSILFPHNTKAISAESLYFEGIHFKLCSVILEKTFDSLVSQWKDRLKIGRKLKVIEIGAGTGSATSRVLAVLKEREIQFEYTYTDISAAFFRKAETKFAEYGQSIKYKTFDAEISPIDQGFILGSYDIVIASNVLHATKDLGKTVTHTRELLKDDGFALIVETFLPVRYLDLTVGLLDGYWKQIDLELRPTSCLIDHSTWNNLLKKSAFEAPTMVKVAKDSFGILVARAKIQSASLGSKVDNKFRKIWLIFNFPGCKLIRELKNRLFACNRKIIEVYSSESFENLKANLKYHLRPNVKEDFTNLLERISNDHPKIVIEGVIYLWGLQEVMDQSIILQGYLHLAQALISGSILPLPKIVAVTQGIVNIDDQEVTLPSSSTIWGFSRSFRSENPSLICRTIDIDSTSSGEVSAAEIFSELWKDDNEYQVAFRSGFRYYPRIAHTHEPKGSSLILPNSGRFEIVLPKSKAIKDLSFQSITKTNLTEDNIEIQVKAVGLNFRDVIAVLKPTPEFETVNSIGIDFSGIVTALGPDVKNRKVGDEIISCKFHSTAFRSHIQIKESETILLPRGLTFEEGATLPAVFFTAYYCLITIGKLHCGETLLIHTASGGVGLCAIQLAQQIGANIIATAGSERKRAYLKLLGIEYIFNSRDTSFGQNVDKVTNGKGVDMVLNSITGPGFKEESLRVCNNGARFIEMSKLNIWQPDEVKRIRPDVIYSIVDLTSVEINTSRMLLEQLDGYLTQEKIQPIPYTRFDAVDVREAMNYLQRAQHVGKVVCSIPNVGCQNMKKMLFNNRSTYLITGGLGGIGLEVSKWMVDLGAKYIVLNGRQAPSIDAENTIKQLKTAGNDVHVFLSDIGNYEGCEKLIAYIKSEDTKLPPLKGIMHAAGCISDGSIMNQSWEKFETAFNGKVNGAWNLHRLTLNSNLEHFVVFSSVATIFGTMGQSNHSAANAFLDALAHYRYGQGLPATTINWGQWGEVGVAKSLEFNGITPFTPKQGLDALEWTLKTHKTQILAFEADLGVIKRRFSWLAPYFDEMAVVNKPKSKEKFNRKVASEKFWETLDGLEFESKIFEIEKVVRVLIKEVLKLDKEEVIDRNQHLPDLGVDSLMMIELKNCLQEFLGQRLSSPLGDLNDCTTVKMVAEKINEIIKEGEDYEVREKQRLKQLIIEDSVLPGNIQPPGKSIPCSEIETVLLTGATGYLAAYLILNLSKRTHIKKIFCLIRGNGPMDRLVRNLEEKGLLKDVCVEKLEVVEGNIVEINLGLKTEIVERLATEVDAIVHCAVKSNHVEEYKKVEGNFTNIRSVNVGGTLRVLEFASLNRTKWVYHASSLLAFTKTGSDDQRLPETWPEEGEYDNFANLGYGISKYVEDRLIMQAVERGIPCKVFRFPLIGGDSKTGRFEIQGNHFYLRLLSFMQSGVMPRSQIGLQIVPVDVCADLSLTAFFHKDGDVGIYNLTNPHGQFENDFVILAEEFGFCIKLVEVLEFAQKIREDGPKSLLHPFREIYLDEKNMNYLTEFEFFQDWSKKNPETYFRSEKLSKLIDGYPGVVEKSLDVLKRDFVYAKNIGIFKDLGL